MDIGVRPARKKLVPVGLWRWVAVGLCLVWSSILLMRAMGPSDLLDNSQDRQAAYVQDLLVNGHVAVQYDQNGLLCAKPPLYTWLASLWALPSGRATELGLHLTSALAVLGTSALVWAVARRRLDGWAALGSALALPFSFYGVRLVYLARADGLYMLLVAGAAMAGLAAWDGGVNWLWFWLLAAGATLTKGPQGLIPPVVALIICARSAPRLTGPPRPRPAWRDGWLGPALFLSACLGWLAWASWASGGEAIHRMLGQELIGHAVNSKGRGASLIQTLHLPSQWLLQKFFPWSLLAAVAIGQSFRQPPDTPASRLVRFSALYVLGGLLMFSLASHKRADLLAILLPPASWLAGAQLAAWKERWHWSPRAILGSLALMWLVVLAGTWWDYQSKHRCDNRWVVWTGAVHTMARQFDAEFGHQAPLFCVRGWQYEPPQAFQFYLVPVGVNKGM